MVRYIVGLLVVCALFTGCAKTTSGSKIPQISFISMIPQDSLRVNRDTCEIIFGLTDGDGDIGNDSASGIFIKDSRYDSAGFVYVDFPPIDPTIEDPSKGLTGTCQFYPIPQPVPRDSLHGAIGDTFTYEMYITDRAGHASNHITTPPLIIYSH